MYKLLDILNPNQINFLLSIGIDIYDKEYTVDEVSDIYFAVMDKLSDNLGDEIKSAAKYHGFLIAYPVRNYAPYPLQ